MWRQRGRRPAVEVEDFRDPAEPSLPHGVWDEAEKGAGARLQAHLRGKVGMSRMRTALPAKADTWWLERSIFLVLVWVHSALTCAGIQHPLTPLTFAGTQLKMTCSRIYTSLIDSSTDEFIAHVPTGMRSA